MPTITSGRLALATSSLALVVAVGGVGYAAATIGTADLKKNAVTSQKIKNNNVTGKDVKESSLKKVPSAATADTATTADSVAGVVVKEVHYIRTAPTAGEVVFNGGGLVLTAACATGGELSLTAATSQDATISAVVTVDNGAGQTGQDTEGFELNPGETFDMLVGTAANITVVDAHFFTRGGSTVTMRLFADETSTECYLNGHVIQS